MYRKFAMVESVVKLPCGEVTGNPLPLPVFYDVPVPVWFCYTGTVLCPAQQNLSVCTLYITSTTYFLSLE